VPAGEPNSIGRTLGLLGDEWSLQIIRYAAAGVRRFGGWKLHLGISDAVLSARLANLVEAAELVRVPASAGVGHPEYVLTASGLALWPVLLSIWSWEQHHVLGKAALLPRMVHSICGSEFKPVLRCGRCEGAAPIEGVELALGPSGDFERSVPVGSNRRRTTGGGRTASGAGMFTETMTLIGSRWSSAMLGAAVLGAVRFSDFERMTGASPAVVAERLRAFVDLGVLDSAGEGAREEGWPSSASYRLSAKGRAFFPVVATALAWGEHHFPCADGPAVLAVHRLCQKDFVPELGCSVCGGALTSRALVVSPPDVQGPFRH
jgi:DNA-binding HxlR family transcriptional regulator